MGDTLAELLRAQEDQITRRYTEAMQASSALYSATPVEEIRRNVHRSLQLVGTLYRNPDDAEAAAYIRSLCEQRVPRGFRLGEVLTAIFMLSDIVVPVIRETYDEKDRRQTAEDQLRTALHRLATLWADGYFDLQEEILAEKDRAVRMLSTPAIQVWEGILTLPLIGEIDEERSLQITDELLNRIVQTQAAVVLLDITGLVHIDTEMIAKLIQTVRAAELLGAQCWVVGVSPEVAHTIVDLGIDLGSITTYSNLRRGLVHAFAYLGLAVRPQD